MKITDKQIIEQQKRIFKDKIDKKGYFNKPEQNLLEIFSNWKEIENELNKGKGNELENKFLAVHSSSALCVNNFTPFKESKNEISFCGNSNFEEAIFEKELSTGISKPNLDFYLENEKVIIGIESKFTEYFKNSIKHTKGNLCKYYKRKELSYLPDKFNSLISEYIECPDELHLDVAQLIKHIIGLVRTKNQKNKEAILIYIYWQPENWQDFENCKQHIEDINEFAKKVKEFEGIITFKPMSYHSFWKEFESCDILKEHLENVKTRYNFKIY